MDGYRIVEPKIVISTPSFSKAKLFGSGMGVSVIMGENFGKIVFPEISDEIPASSNLAIMSRDLTVPMTDWENLREMGYEKLFSPNEWAEILYFNLISRYGRSFFKTEAKTNLSYLELKDRRILAVYALLNSENGIWRFGANSLDDKRREDVGRRLFSRNSDKKK